MQPGAKIDGSAKFAPVLARLSSERVKGVETGPDAVALADPVIELPCRDQFVSDVAVDFSTRRHDWVGQIGHETI